MERTHRVPRIPRQGFNYGASPDELAQILGEHHEVLMLESRHGQGVARRTDGSILSFWKVWDGTLGKWEWQTEDLSRHHDVVEEWHGLRHSDDIPAYNRAYNRVLCAFARPATMPLDIYDVQWHVNAGYGYPIFLIRIGWVEKGSRSNGIPFRIINADTADCHFEVSRGNGDFWCLNLVFEGHYHLITNGNGTPPQSLPRPNGDLIISSAAIDENLIAGALGLRRGVRAPFGKTS